MIQLFGVAFVLLILPLFEFIKHFLKKNKRAIRVFLVKYFVPRSKLPLYINDKDRLIKEIVNNLLKMEK